MASCSKNTAYAMGSDPGTGFQYLRNIVLIDNSGSREILVKEYPSPDTSPTPPSGSTTQCNMVIADTPIVLRQVEDNTLYFQDPSSSDQVITTTVIDLATVTPVIQLEYAAGDGTLRIIGDGADIIMTLTGGVRIEHDVQQQELIVQQLKP